MNRLLINFAKLWLVLVPLVGLAEGVAITLLEVRTVLLPRLPVTAASTLDIILHWVREVTRY